MSANNDDPPKKREPLWPIFLALIALGLVLAQAWLWFH
jgi:hypothetical protein